MLSLYLPVELPSAFFYQICFLEHLEDRVEVHWVDLELRGCDRYKAVRIFDDVVPADQLA